MFDKLILSSSESRTGRVTKFLIVTVISYMACIAVALAASILTSNPQMTGLGGQSPKVAPALMPVRPYPADRSPQQPDIGRRQPLTGNFQIMRTPDLSQSPREDSAPRLIPLVPPDIHWDATGGSELNGIVRSAGGREGFGEGFGPLGLSAVPAPAPPPRIEREKSKPIENKTPLRVSQRVLQGKVTARVSPTYPTLAKLARVSGSVVVEIVISPDGVVESARAISGHPLLIPAAIESARGWRFQPTLLGDVPFRVTGLITFVFTLN